MRELGRRLEYPCQVQGSDRRAQVVALDLRVPLPPPEIELLLGLDPFRRGRDAEAAAERRDGAHDGTRVAVLLGELAQEAAVELDLVEREALEIAERRVPGSEIVE